MGQTSIEWTSVQKPDGTYAPGYTFNIVIGCHPVSPGCAHCYARDLARNRMQLDVWDDKTAKPRKTLSEAYWKQPLTWNRKALKEGVRRKVFCSSMADVFEDHPTVAQERAKLWPLIEATPALDWLLLTKRPEHVMDMVPERWQKRLPINVWLGASAENQRMFNERIDALTMIPASVLFLSCEPLLGPIDISEWVEIDTYPLAYTPAGDPVTEYWTPLSWIIVGAESGPKARPMQLDWVRAIRDECAGHIPFLFKQDAKDGHKLSLPALDGKVWHEFPTPDYERLRTA